jgi:hypothetical protein
MAVMIIRVYYCVVNLCAVYPRPDSISHIAFNVLFRLHVSLLC